MSKPPPRSPRSRRSTAQRIEDLAPASDTQAVDQSDDSSQLKTVAIIAAVAIVFLLLLLLLLFAGAGAAVALSGSGSGTGSGSGSGNQTSPSNGELVADASSPGDSTADRADSFESSQSAQVEGNSQSTGSPEQASSQQEMPSVKTSTSEGINGDEEEVSVVGEMVDLNKKPAPPSSAPVPTGRVITIPGGEFFGIRSEGNSFVYIIDCSGSMWAGNRFDRAKSEVIRSVNSLVEQQEFFVYFFDDNEYGMYYPNGSNGELVPATSANKQKLADWVRQFQTPSGGTDPSSAIVATLRMDPEVVFLLTDGGFSESVVDLTKQSNTNRTRINTVSFVTKEGEPLLRKIAEQNRGKYLFVP